MSETHTRNAICTWLKLKGAFVFIHDSIGVYDERGFYRVRSSVHKTRGVSDLIGIWRSKFLAVEVKSKTGKLSDFQKQFLNAVNTFGGIGFVARSIEDCEIEFRRRGEM